MSSVFEAIETRLKVTLVESASSKSKQLSLYKQTAVAMFVIVPRFTSVSFGRSVLFRGASLKFQIALGKRKCHGLSSFQNTLRVSMKF